MIIENLLSLEHWATHRRNRGGTIVATNGCFDLLHPGHVELLRLASNLGDRVVVGVDSDMLYQRNRGHAPILNGVDRATMVAAVRYVEAVFLFDDCAQFLTAVRPDIYVKGNGYTPDSLHAAEKAALPSHCLIHCIDHPVGIHTSDLLKRIRA